MPIYQLPVWLWPTALLCVCGLALWRGRDEERLAAAVNLATWAVTRLVFHNSSEDTQWFVMVTDLAQLGFYVWIALRSRRHWPMFAAGFTLLMLITHIARAVDTGISGWAYLTAGIIWSYLVLFAIGYGAWTAPYFADTDDPTDAPGATRR